MNKALIDTIANAVLYEGYLLYPYRPSVKNRQRWTFGGLYPKSYCDNHGETEPWFAQTECLVEESGDSALSVRIRFLHLQNRRVEPAEPSGESASAIRLPAIWQEAVEREVDCSEDMLFSDLITQTKLCNFSFPARCERDLIRGAQGDFEGNTIREQKELAGQVEVRVEQLENNLYKVHVQVRNKTPLEEARTLDRDLALLHSLVSTHTILGVKDGAFVSSIDPPERFKDLAAGCRNVQSFPVLVGDEGATDAMLSSPIILYDHPQIAPESPGDLFDSTEIDEILTLRILTLTDDEKRLMAAVDDRARALLERTEALAHDQLMGLHGTIRGLRPL